MTKPDGNPETRQRIIKCIFTALMTILIISGFAQMPVFKRYYIADIPGFSWTANFFVTHVMHYTASALLIGLLSCLVSIYFLSGRNSFSLTRTGMIKVTVLTLLVLTGIGKVISNLQDAYFGMSMLVSLNIIHISFTMIYLFLILYSTILKKKWLVQTEVMAAGTLKKS